MKRNAAFQLDQAAEEFAAAGAVALVLLGQAGNADGREFILVAIEPAGEALAERAGIELASLARAIQGDGEGRLVLAPQDGSLCGRRWPDISGGNTGGSSRA